MAQRLDHRPQIVFKDDHFRVTTDRLLTERERDLLLMTLYDTYAGAPMELVKHL